MIYDPALNNPNFSDRLAFDIALALEGSGDDMQDILKRHYISASDILTLNQDPLFTKAVSKFREDIRANGITFKMKARAQAEELLTTSWHLIHSPDVSAAVKADLIKSTVKWAGLEPKDDKSGGDAGGGVKIMINMGGTPMPLQVSPVIEHEPAAAKE